jgi:hypothetical protein
MKTITSTLTGVEVAKGFFASTSPSLSFFPKESPADADERKRAITVENLLCMLRIRIGLDGVYRISPHGPFGLPAGATATWRSETELLPDRAIEVSADEASGLIRNGKLVGTPR